MAHQNYNNFSDHERFTENGSPFQTDYNMGLYFTRPSNASLYVHSHALATCHHDQSFRLCMARVLKYMKDNEKIKHSWLSEETFPSGIQYFEKGKTIENNR